MTSEDRQPEIRRHQNGDTVDTESVTERHQYSVKPDTETVHIKEKKETYKETEKESGARTQRAMFEIWWEAYPKKRSKGQAWKAWQAIKPDEQLLADMLLSVKAAMKTPDWKKQAGQFVPYPATWLRAEGWNDVYDVESSHSLGEAVTSTLNNLEDLFGEQDATEEFPENGGLSGCGLRRGSDPGPGGRLLAPAGHLA